ncbi:rRNA-processing protein bfr2 [Umbelopsis sp. WA50703]
MSAKTKKSLAEQLADLDTTAPADIDPEQFEDSIIERGADEDDGAFSDDDDKNARDHYVTVGKSALRNSQFLMEDPKYGGKRSNRKSIFDDEQLEESSDDQDDVHGDEDDEEDEDAREMLNEDESDEELDSDNLGEEDADKESEEEEDDEEGSDENESDEEAAPLENEAEVQEELRRLRDEEKKMISGLNKTAQADVEKGQHVKQQLTLWDGFLDTRIRMQKAMNIANQLPQFDAWPEFLMDDESIPHVESTKAKLRSLIDSVMDLRVDLIKDNVDSIIIPKDATNSRKRHLDDDDEYVEKLWDDMSQLNDLFTPYRNSTIEKWGNKVQIASGIPLNKKFKAFDQNIMTQVDTILGDGDRLIKRTQLKRTEYQPLGKEASNKEDSKDGVDEHLADHDAEIFDDNDFYQQLLKELIESRMVDTDDPIALGMRWAALKQNKQKKKVVDTRASKGRRLRYHVHEKLQNFMVPIPTGTWHEEMIDELYASLLGRKQMDLTGDADIEEDKAADEEEHEIVNGEAVDGLRIFG